MSCEGSTSREPDGMSPEDWRFYERLKVDDQRLLKALRITSSAGAEFDRLQDARERWLASHGPRSQKRRA